MTTKIFVKVNNVQGEIIEHHIVGTTTSKNPVYLFKIHLIDEQIVEKIYTKNRKSDIDFDL